VKLKLTQIRAGNFMMGSPETEEGRWGNETAHRVSVSRNFYLGVYPVTQEQYQAVMGNNPSEFQGKSDSPKRPVENVSWEEAQEFCRKLSLKTGRKARLPTEAEWEYACRAGTTTPFSFGATISTEQANYEGDSTYGKSKKGIYREETTVVGSFSPNAWGLYDMHGNVWEWCEDWYDSGYYKSSPAIDPVNREKAGGRVCRGGSWYRIPQGCRSASRGGGEPDNRGADLGFRIAVD
jgi:formylglycine-generating enzyme required for sulfatase activity